MGKLSWQRPKAVTDKELAENWERIFGKPLPKLEKETPRSSTGQND